MNEVKHGTWYAYRWLKCRCGVCRAFVSAYNHAYKQRRYSEDEDFRVARRRYNREYMRSYNGSVAGQLARTRHQMREKEAQLG